MFAAGFAPIVAIQNVANSKFSGIMDPFFAAVAAGAVSAGASCSIEGVSRQQEITGKNFSQTISDMNSKGGVRVFQRGYIPTAIREGGFAGACFGAVPIVTEELENKGFSKVKARLCAGIGSGVAAAIITHPFDTYKTKVQSNLTETVSIRKVFKLERAFWGISWRISMVVTATTAIPITKEQFELKLN